MIHPAIAEYIKFGAAFTGIVAFIGTIAMLVLNGKFINPTQLRDHCENCQAKCRPLLCGKIEQVRKEISAMDQKREAARKENYDFQKAIYEHMGDVKRYMRDHQS